MFDKLHAEQLANISKISFTDDEINKMTEDMISITELMDNIRDFCMMEDEKMCENSDYSELREDIGIKSEVKEKSAIIVPKVV